MSTLRSHNEAINHFLGKAIESNLLDTVKGLVDAFKGDIDFTCHDVKISLYSVYRGNNPDMMQFLFDHGAELELHQVSQTINESPIDVFKVIFKKYEDWFDLRTSRDYYPQVVAISNSKFDKVAFLHDKGYKLTPDLYPLRLMSDDIFNREGERRTFAVQNIKYTREDFEALSDDSKIGFLQTLARSGKDYIEAVEGSHLDFTLDIPALAEMALKHENSYLTQKIMARGNKVDVDLPDCNATKFIDNIDAFSVAIRMDKTLTEPADADGKRQSFLYRLTSILELEDKAFLDVTLKHSPVLQGLRDGTLHSATHKRLIQGAFEYIQHAPMLDAFFDILPDNTFSGNDLLENICYESADKTKALSAVPFLLKAETKGAMLCKDFFFSFIDNALRTSLNHYKSSEVFTRYAALLKFGQERHGEAIYNRIRTVSDLCGKSEKQMLSSFRTSFYSSNDNTKATLVALMIKVSNHEQRIAFINAMTYKEDLNNDIAFKEALSLWNITPLEVAEWDISNKVKTSIANAICNL